MNAQLASLILELLANAGWLDDADDLIHDMLNDAVGVDEVRAKCRFIDDTIRQANEFLPDIQRAKASTEQTLDDLL